MNKDTVLVIAPHADDEVLGCGATIAKYVAAGAKVYVLVMTNAHIGAPDIFTLDSILEVRNEALAAHALLGVEKTIFLDFPAPALDACPVYKIASAISEVISKIRPSVMYLPFPGDIHLDHYTVHRAGLVAARPQQGCPVKSIFCYETLSETEWASSQGDNAFSPNCFIDVSEFFDKKIEAMSCYASQLKSFPHPRSLEALEGLAKFRGSTVGVRRAESFFVERIIF